MKSWEYANLFKRLVAAGELDKVLDDLDGAVGARRRAISEIKKRAGLEVANDVLAAHGIVAVSDKHPKSELRGARGPLLKLIHDRSTAVIGIDPNDSANKLAHAATSKSGASIRKTGKLLVSVKYVARA